MLVGSGQATETARRDVERVEVGGGTDPTLEHDAEAARGTRAGLRPGRRDELRRGPRRALMPTRAPVGERRELFADRDAVPLVAKGELDLPVLAALAPKLDATADRLRPDDLDASTGVVVGVEEPLDPGHRPGDGFLSGQPRVLLAGRRRVVDPTPEPDVAELRDAAGPFPRRAPRSSAGPRSCSTSQRYRTPGHDS